MVYDFNDVKVWLTWQEFMPNGIEPSPEKAVLFFPGWPLKQAPIKSIQRIGEEFAKNSCKRTYVIFTRSDQVITNPSYYEATAVCKFLAEKNFKSIILVGYSQGGIKAIDMLVLLQQMPQNICVDGLVLINSAGLNNIDNKSFITRQLLDLSFLTLLITLRDSGSEYTLRRKISSFIRHVAIPFRGINDFALSVWRDAKPSIPTFFSRFIREVDESTKRSPYLDQIRVPVVIIQGAEDHSFDTDKVLTQAKVQSTACNSRAKRLSLFSKVAKKQIPIADLFPQSPYTRLLRVRKYGTHLLPFLRPEAVAQASLYMLKRFDRSTGFGK